MARPLSIGLKYTNLDVNFFQDRKIRRLQRRFGPSSPLVYIALLCSIYAEGYYIKWDDDVALDLADALKMEESDVKTIIEGCMAVGLLSQEMFDNYQILTSHGIQKQYQTISEQCKRKSVVSKYSLLVSSEVSNENDDTNEVSSEETPKENENNELTPKEVHKEKYSKVKERKENQSKDYYSSSSARALSEEEKEQQQFLSHMFFMGWAAPSKEYQKFIAYNRTGGRNWDKMSHNERAAALFLWKQEPEQKRLGEKFLAFWRKVYDTLVSMGAPYEVCMDALTDGIKWDAKNNNVHIYCPERLKEFIERHMDAFKADIRAFQRAGAYSDKLFYEITPPYTPCSP